jgi:hypothetical protein
MSGDDIAGECACPQIGAHVVTPRCAYKHHGIYVGDGYVVHYAGSFPWLRGGPIERVTVEEFTQGRCLAVTAEPAAAFATAEIVRRALSRVGEARYHLLTNNCEHFCEWCLRGEPRSRQVERWVSAPRGLVISMTNALAKMITAPIARIRMIERCSS